LALDSPDELPAATLVRCLCQAEQRVRIRGGEAERLAGLPAGRAAIARAAPERRQLAEHIAQLGVEFNAATTKSLSRGAHGQMVYAQATDGIRTSTVEFQRARLKADIELAAAWDYVPKAEKQKALAWADTVDPAMIGKAREGASEGVPPALAAGREARSRLDVTRKLLEAGERADQAGAISEQNLRQVRAWAPRPTAEMIRQATEELATASR
jgi:hypothetical protein